jgi:hypothetical protein
MIHLSDRAEAFRLADFAGNRCEIREDIVGFFFDSARLQHLGQLGGAIGNHAFAFTIQTMRCCEVGSHFENLCI